MVIAWQGRGMASVNQTRPHCVNQMGKTHSKPLAARHGRGTAWARHAMCESALIHHNVRTYLPCHKVCSICKGPWTVTFVLKKRFFLSVGNTCRTGNMQQMVQELNSQMSFREQVDVQWPLLPTWQMWILNSWLHSPWRDFLHKHVRSINPTVIITIIFMVFSNMSTTQEKKSH
jgi:hypothetical protein